MIIALAQVNPTIGALHNNAEKMIRIIEQCRDDGVELVVFPELAVTGYPPRDLLLYQAFLQEVERITLQEILPATADITVIMGSPWRTAAEEEKLYNAALVMKNMEIFSIHQKTLLPNYDVFDENRYFAPAPRRNVLDLAGKKIAGTVCEDIWNDKDYWERRLYDQDPVEELCSQGAELLVNISASPYHLGKVRERSKMLSALAKKYRLPLVYVNQVGGNDELIFDGSSLVVTEHGEIACQAPCFQEGVRYFALTEGRPRLVSPVENRKPVGGASSKAHAGLAAPTPWRLDAHPEAPGAEGADHLHQALVLGLRDYLKKTGFDRVVIGLSGGIDSAVTAALAVTALGAGQVLGVLMPSRYSSRDSIKDSLELAKNLGMKTRVIPIEKPFAAFLDLMNGKRLPRLDLAEENIQARIRGNILMFISNRERRMVLTTGNKSELAVGYCTLYGDMSGGLALLADVPKTMVYQLALYMNEKKEGEVVPRGVIAKAPSAELRPDQKDRDSLPPYEILDRVLHMYIEENCHLEEIVAAGFRRKTVKDIIEKVDHAEYKRFQAAPGLRVTTRAFGSGRRMPIARSTSVI